MAWCSLLSKNDMQLLTGLLDYHVAKRRSVWPQSGWWLLRPLYMCGLSVVNNHFLMLTLSSVYDSVIYNTIQSSIHNLQSKRGSLEMWLRSSWSPNSQICISDIYIHPLSILLRKPIWCNCSYWNGTTMCTFWRLLMHVEISNYATYQKELHHLYQQ